MGSRHRAAVSGAAAVAFALAGCGSSPASTPPTTHAVSRPASAAPKKPRSPIDRLVVVARRRYLEEVQGAAAHKQLRRVAADPVLLRALRTHDLAALRAEVRRQDATPHAHISRLRVVRGARVLADAGVVFVVAPAHKALHDARGRYLGTLQLSIQDVIGYVKYLRRNVHVDVVVRGSGAAHVRSSLPGAARLRLPSAGTVSIGGHRYRVRSFRERGLAGETLRIWILERG
jgi:hypothetical protein